MSPLPPIDELLPHRGTMLLLDRVVDFGRESAVAEYTPRRDAWYADDSGDMPAWVGIELMAQTVAVLAALNKRLDGLPPKMGVLLGTRRYQSSRSRFAAGRALRIRVETVLGGGSGLAAYSGTIECDGTTLATSTLKVYEPENFDQFVEGSL